MFACVQARRLVGGSGTASNAFAAHNPLPLWDHMLRACLVGTVLLRLQARSMVGN
jgi:hypothetical protein